MTLTKRSSTSVVSAPTFSAVVFSAVTFVAALLVAAPAARAAEPPPNWHYTMVAFSNATDRAMDVYESTDGLNYRLETPAAYVPPSGAVRDPSIFRNSDGTYYVTYTTADGANIGFARSSDRIHWTHMENWPVPFCCAFLPGTGDGTGSSSPPGFAGSAGFKDGPSLSPFTTKAWAPEWFVDGNSVNVILSMSTGGGFVPYVMTALEPTLHLWSPPVPLAGIGADHIDTTVVKVGSTYHAFTKNETKKVLQHAVSSSLTGPYSFVEPGDWGTMVEGPSVIQLPNGSWRMYFDGYDEGAYYYSDSPDLYAWSARQELPGLSGTVRHVGVMREAG